MFYCLSESSLSPMSSSSSSGSIVFPSNPTEKVDYLPCAPSTSNWKNTGNSNVSLNADMAENFNRMAKTLNSKSNEYRHSNIAEKYSENLSDNADLEESETENKEVTNEMNNALDVFFKFEDVADSELRECSEFQAERAIIREMCNVVIKQLDSSKEWNESS